ncbi:hypothetical protein HU830_07265 [Lactobacillus sp. DCY120]|uniref:Uncharacterized protein n=1 Tax=Bombilactobacillus apium TaxID=2675299 RepID=A0A850RDY6_9LACO|nr:hypothetical protein [Bombilactobacillus apium]NVY96948.1 hypothetical protein [Bombilactobacillus apium]
MSSSEIIDQLEERIKVEPDFTQRAFYQGLITLLRQQDQRIEQLQGEIDGRLWSHDNW